VLGGAFLFVAALVGFATHRSQSSAFGAFLFASAALVSTVLSAVFYRYLMRTTPTADTQVRLAVGTFAISARSQISISGAVSGRYQLRRGLPDLSEWNERDVKAYFVVFHGAQDELVNLELNSED
jgi:hypothetical protein